MVDAILVITNQEEIWPVKYTATSKSDHEGTAPTMDYWNYVVTLDRKLSLQRRVSRSTHFAYLDLPSVRLDILHL